MPVLDHLVYATHELGAGIAALEGALGVRASPGGSHPGWGTHNALLALGPAVYLEVVAADPSQAVPARIFGLDRLPAPRLVTWAASAANLAHWLGRGRSAGLDLGDIGSGSRQRADGTMLQWRMTDPLALREEGAAPFLIDWGGTPHPAHSAARGCALDSWWIEHPEPARLEPVLAALECRATVRFAREPGIVAVIDSPRGRVELR